MNKDFQMNKMNNLLDKFIRITIFKRIAQFIHRTDKKRGSPVD